MSMPISLFCLPHGGAGASVYRPWSDRLPPDVELVPLQLPGREARFREPLARSMTEIMAALREPMLARAGERFALFGHSLGALLAFELAYVAIQHDRLPAHLFVSGCPAPHLVPRAGQAAVHLLPDEELLAHVREENGTPAGVLSSPELMRVLLPVLRADYEISETYRCVRRPPLPVPISAFGGAEDPNAEPAELDAWRHHTTRGFVRHRFPGDHFYLLRRPEVVINEMTGVLRGARGDRSGRPDPGPG